MGSSSGSLFRTSSEQVRFAATLAARYRSGAPLWDPDEALIRDADWWSKVLRDGGLAHAIRQRLAKVVRDDWSMKPGGEDEQSKTVAAIFEEMFRKIRLFSASRRHLAKFAFHGNAHAWIEGRREWCTLGAGEKNPVGYLAEWWLPRYVKPLDKRQILLVPVLEGGQQVRVEQRMATIDGGTHAPILNPECLVSAIYDDEVERLGSGRGLGEAIYHGYWRKGQVRELWLRGVARWAMGVIVGKIDAAAHANVDTGSTSDAVTTMQEVLQTMGEGGVFTIDKRDEIDVLFGGEGSGDAKDAMVYEDKELTQLILGSVLPTGGGGDVGSMARAETESDTSDDLLDSDREMLDEVLTERLVRLCWNLNQANFAAVGLAAAKMPRFNSMRVHEETSEEAGNTLKVAHDLGLEISKEEAYRRLQVSPPGPEEDVIEPAAPPNPFGGGLPGFPPEPPPEFAAMGVTGEAWRALCARFQDPAKGVA